MMKTWSDSCSHPACLLLGEQDHTLVLPGMSRPWCAEQMLILLQEQWGLGVLRRLRGFSLLLGEWFLWVLGSQRAGLCHREWQRTRTELQLLLESRGHTYLVFCLLGGSLIALGMVNGTGSSKHRWGWGQVLGRGWALGQGVRRCWPISTPVLTLLTHPSYVSPGWTPQLCGASWGGGNFFFPVHTTDLAGLGSGLGNFWVLFLLLYVVGRQRKDKELTFAWGINHR